MAKNNLTPAERRLASQAGAHKSWAATEDRTARTAKPRKAFEDRFLTQAGGDPKRAASLRREYHAQLTFRSVKARRLAKEARAGGDRDTA